MVMAAAITKTELKARLAALPRLRLAALPTPLHEVPRLSAALGGPRILIKREDLTGVALGGNKIREFEYSLAPAVEQGYDVLINSAAAQSNQSCQTAAVAAKLGLRSVIIGRTDAYAQPIQGNLLLCHLFGAEVHLPSPDQQKQEKEAIVKKLRVEGHRPYDTGYDGAACRTVAYVDGFLELWGQLRERGIRPDALYVCSGDHTHVGLVVAAKALGIDLRIVGVPYSPRYDNAEKARRLAAGANEAAGVLGLDLSFGQEDMETYVEFAGPAYGVVSEAALEAIRLATCTEGLVLDPVYTGKTMAGLIAHIREGQFSRDQTVIFIHTGGLPALFAYNTELGLDA
jgi:1-aminocyclopropane-1-carboxylate deaminase/D-cysteine desulfhydrase-like pyridoxal-dependent ACC family enzyme